MCNSSIITKPLGTWPGCLFPCKDDAGPEGWRKGHEASKGQSPGLTPDVLTLGPVLKGTVSFQS